MSLISSFGTTRGWAQAAGLGVLCAVTAITQTAFAQPAPDDDDNQPTLPQPPTSPPPSSAPSTGPIVIHVEPTAPSPPPATPSPPPSAAQPTLAGPRVGGPSPWAAGEDAAAYQDTELDAPYPRRAHFMGRIGVGPSVYSFYGDRLLTGGPDVTLAADTKAGSYGGNFGFSVGRTEPGLHAWRVYFGADLEWPIGPVRLGIAPRAGVLSIARLTQNDSFVFVTAGIAGVFSIDLVESEGFSLALAVRPSIENASQLFGDSVGLYGGTALLDFRFRAAKTSPPKPPKPKRPRY